MQRNYLTSSIRTTRDLIIEKQISANEFIHAFIEEYKSTNDYSKCLQLMDVLFTVDQTRSFAFGAFAPIFNGLRHELLNKDPERYAAFVIEYFPKVNKDFKDIVNELTSDVRLLPTLLEKIPEMVKDKPDLALICVKSFIAKYQSYLLNEMLELFDKEELAYINKNLKPTETKILNQLKEQNNMDKKRFSSYTQQFVNGYGKINYQGGLLSCAQIQERKAISHAYDFNPTVIDAQGNEFVKYLEIIKKSQLKPLRAKFIIADVHWFAGEIEITQDGRARILIIDSLGKDSSFFPTDLMTQFSQVFPQGDIYFSTEKRQHASAGCSVYAIDDITHLYTLEKFIDKPSKNYNLFDYLEENITKSKTLDSSGLQIEYKLCKLPITLLRTKQSTKLFPLFSERSPSEQSLKINKKGETAFESAAKGFVDIEDNSLATHTMESVLDMPSYEISSFSNKRIDKKLKNLADRNFDYLLYTNAASLDQSLYQFTLRGFENKILELTNLEKLSFKE